jgi:predicted phage tail protein
LFLTAYDRQARFISLRDQTNDTVQTVVNNYQEIVELLKKYPECKLTFLEVDIADVIIEFLYLFQ